MRGIFDSGAAAHRAYWRVCAPLLVAWLTVLAFLLPYFPDEAVYKIIATGIVHGKWPYHALFDHKPPLIYLWYLPAGLGASIQAERILAALLVAASVPIVAVLARRRLTGRQVPLATAAYALLLANPFMVWGANTEAFLLLPLVAALAVPSPLLAGVLLGFAVMTKPVALAFAPVLVLFWRRDVWRVAIGGGLICLLVSLPFIPIWHDFWEANITFNLDYARQLGYGSGLHQLLIPNPGVLIGGLPLWCAALVGAIRQRDRLIWVWALCALISVRASGLNNAYQYVLLAPPAALLAGIGLDRILRSRILAVTESILSAGTLVAVATALVLFGGARPFEPMVDAVRTAEGEVYVLGGKTEIYIYADHQPQRRFFYSVPLVVRSDWGREMREQLLACPPDVLVIPEGSLFQVDWTDDVAPIYEERTEFDSGMVLTQPSVPCVGRDSVR